MSDRRTTTVIPPSDPLQAEQLERLRLCSAAPPLPYLTRRSSYATAAAALPVAALRQWALAHGWEACAVEWTDDGRLSARGGMPGELRHVASQTPLRLVDDLVPAERLHALEVVSRLADLHAPVLLHEILSRAVVQTIRALMGDVRP